MATYGIDIITGLPYLISTDEGGTVYTEPIATPTNANYGLDMLTGKGYIVPNLVGEVVENLPEANPSVYVYGFDIITAEPYVIGKDGKIPIQNHNELANIQGGAVGEYNHISNAELNKISTLDATYQAKGTYLTGTKVDSFNNRVGAVSLAKSDVETALTGVILTHSHGGANIGDADTLDGYHKDDILNYIQARGQNLITNGTGLLGTNYNFSSFTFDRVETAGGGGSFYNPNGAMLFSDEYIALNPDNYYRFSMYGKSGNADGSNRDTAARQFGGIQCYDIDKNQIIGFKQVQSGGVDTYLATDLNTGDLVINLVNGTSWRNQVGTDYTRHICFYGYKNSFGYTYPDYTYTRLHSGNYGYGNSPTNTPWGAGGVSGNTITLQGGGWKGGFFPAGTAVRNTNNDGGYTYSIFSNILCPTTWTKYETTIGTQGNGTYKFLYGTAFVKLFWLNNWYKSIPIASQRWSMINFTEVHSNVIIPTTPTSIGTLGDVAWDASYMYLCTATNTWKRSAISTW